MKTFVLGEAGAIGAALMMACIATTTPAAAQDAVQLPTNAPGFDAKVAVLGAADTRAGFTFQVALKMRHAEELRARIERGEDIADADLAARYLPTEASYHRVLDWLAANGLTATRTYGDHLTVEASGPVGTVGAALRVSFKRVRVEGAEYVATDAAPTMPASVAAEIEGVNGLQPYLHMTKMTRLAPAASVSPNATITGNYYPGGILRTYQALPYLTQNGAGTRTAIVIDTFPNVSDLTQFWSLTGVPQTISNIEFVQAVAGALPASTIEDSLDVEWASGIGYGSKVRVYATATLAYTNIDTAYQAVLSDIGKGVAIQQMSVSLGSCEVFAPHVEVVTENNLLMLLAAKKVSIFISSGDSGSHECGASNPAFPSWASTSPFVTAVGGTSLTATGTGTKLKILSETGWVGSGGGFSNLFDPPSYQKALGAQVRVVPDIAAVADPNTGVVIVLNGKAVPGVGGTSAAAPIWAGLASLVNQARLAAVKPPLGLLNPRIYSLVGTKNFHDDVAGCNGTGKLSAGNVYYCAGKGYDLVTGLGSPVMNALLPTLVAQP